jgi:hypothetical protein
MRNPVPRPTPVNIQDTIKQKQITEAATPLPGNHIPPNRILTPGSPILPEDIPKLIDGKHSFLDRRIAVRWGFAAEVSDEEILQSAAAVTSAAGVTRAG